MLEAEVLLIHLAIQHQVEQEEDFHIHVLQQIMANQVTLTQVVVAEVGEAILQEDKVDKEVQEL